MTPPLLATPQEAVASQRIYPFEKGERVSFRVPVPRGRKTPYYLIRGVTMPWKEAILPRGYFRPFPAGEWRWAPAREGQECGLNDEAAGTR